MPNAILRANAQSLPEPTNRRAILGAVLAAAAAGATAAFPAAASPSPALSAIDRRVIDLWRRRATQAILARLSEESDAAEAKLPRNGRKKAAKMSFRTEVQRDWTRELDGPRSPI